MRIFYEEWNKVLNHQPAADDLVLNEKLLLMTIHQPVADEFSWADFLSIGFSHHTEIIAKANGLYARMFYIHECAIRYWNKYTLRDYLKADLYHHRGALPNNFAQTLPDTKQAIKAIYSFKDDYLLDFINIAYLIHSAQLSFLLYHLKLTKRQTEFHSAISWWEVCGFFVSL